VSGKLQKEYNQSLSVDRTLEAILERELPILFLPDTAGDLWQQEIV
jgi:hypothetical protein